VPLFVKGQLHAWNKDAPTIVVCLCDEQSVVRPAQAVPDPTV
jgi:hypothetical protein